MEMQPSRPQRAKRKPLPPVSNPLTPEDQEEFKYAKRTSYVAAPTIGAVDKVKKVGLGSLTTVTSYGVQPDV
jgi:hypothetical protein